MTKETLLEHFENPRNVGEIASPSGRARAANPVCGDEVLATTRVEEGVVLEVRYRVRGCHATIAAMSVLSERVRGRAAADAASITPEELMGWFEGFPSGKRHAAEVAVLAVRRALGEVSP